MSSTLDHLGLELSKLGKFKLVRFYLRGIY